MGVMTSSRLGLSTGLFEAVFPFHLAFDRQMQIVQAGEIFDRIYPELSVGSRLDECFRIARPSGRVDFGRIRDLSRSVFLLESRHRALQLKGQMVYAEERDVMLFLCSPWVTDLATLSSLGISLSDFAIHEPIADFLCLLHAQNTAVSDLKELTGKLTSQRAELRLANEALEKEQLCIQTLNRSLGDKVRQRTQELSRANRELKAMLKEKEVLLREIHHRVKNNLQVISSLLNLHAERIDDEQALDVFKDSQGRVKSLALIHEKLYRSRDLSRIDFADYIGSLVVDLYHAYGVSSEAVIPKIDADGISLDIDTAMLCGLIITELVSNSLKYAFPEGRQGEVRIHLHPHPHGDGRLALTVADNGVGFPKDHDFRNTESLGLQLVCTLANQLGGAIKLDRTRGTEFKMAFPASKQQESD